MTDMDPTEKALFAFTGEPFWPRSWAMKPDTEVQNPAPLL
jgi:hypothetical protein